MQNREEALSLIDRSRLAECERSAWGTLPFGPGLFDRGFYPLYRRFLCACCRELEPLLPDESRKALDVIERFAYGRESFDEFVTARNAARTAARRVARREGEGSKAHAASQAVRDAARNDGYEALALCKWRLKRAKLSLARQVDIFDRVAAEWIAEQRESD